MTAPAELLEWDTDFWGVRIARVTGSPRAAASWARANGVACLYYLAPADDPARSHEAEAAGYRLMDVRVELARTPAPSSSTARPHHAQDVDVLAAIARASHRTTRFYADSRFPKGRCDDLYETWIRKSCAGWADAVLVVGPQGSPAGYVSCHADDRTGSMGLMAVSEAARGEGIGAELVRAAVDWCAGNGLEEVTVATQARNVAAQRTFESCGFRTASVGLWFHRWLT